MHLLDKSPPHCMTSANEALDCISKSVDIAESYCVIRRTVTSSHRNEHVCAFKKLRTRRRHSAGFHRVSLGAGARCFSAIAPARPQGCESSRTQLRGDN